MRKFSASSFFWMSAYLEIQLKILEDHPKPVLGNAEKKELLEVTNNLDRVCKDIGLSLSAMTVKEMQEALSAPKVLRKDFQKLWEQLRGRISDEVKLFLFVQIPAEKAEYYGDPRKLFGADVLDKFPSIIRDVEEAGKCYATGRNTACAFHSMRILEVGIKVIAASLSISVINGNQNWGSLLGKINEAVQAKRPNDDLKRFYEEVVAHVYAIKNAWRNPTMHVERSYGEESVEVFNAVRGLMRHLVTKLKE